MAHSALIVGVGSVLLPSRTRPSVAKGSMETRTAGAPDRTNSALYSEIAVTRGFRPTALKRGSETLPVDVNAPRRAASGCAPPGAWSVNGGLAAVPTVRENPTARATDVEPAL